MNDVKTRNDLIISHIPLVHSLVTRVMCYANPSLSRDDMVSAGTLALVEAAVDYDPNQGAKFITYAYKRIRWKLLDELKSLRNGISHINLESESEIAAHDDNDSQFEVQQDELLQIAIQYLSKFPKKQRDIMEMYYNKGMTMPQIADTFKVSPSYISLLIRNAILKLKYKNPSLLAASQEAV